MEPKLDRTQQQTLLRIARQSIDSRVRTGGVHIDEPDNGGLNQPLGCFVTIRQQGHLRGCLGNFVSSQPLYREVADLAAAAATKDPRFYPMRPDDLTDFTVEISVLSPLRQAESVEEIEVGRHGILLEKGFARGVLLPQVATEQGWDRQEFLRHLCLKAGLEPDEWQSPEAVLYLFTAQVFGEQNS